jgi:hypothetical protein
MLHNLGVVLGGHFLDWAVMHERLMFVLCRQEELSQTERSEISAVVRARIRHLPSPQNFIFNSIFRATVVIVRLVPVRYEALVLRVLSHLPLVSPVLRFQQKLGAALEVELRCNER